MNMFTKIQGLYGKLVGWLDYGKPVVDLGLRLWVADAFFRSGLVKISNMDSTIDLFTNTYHVQFLPPVFAAYLGTGVELVVPVLLAFGIFGRLTAGFMFVYNLICVISFPDLWPDGFWTGLFGTAFKDHKIWGLMLLVTFIYGPGKLSVDYLVMKFFPRLKPSA
ncbi:MAG TPA: DoxX family protein [Gammaproteobacteria bacterium]|jgi:putative oxidoreductase|nr:DoxX family protein [Gammaproteobacteria bacterium]